jgi:predicted DsbA family dithiol-disulfide isomerase
LLDIGNRVDLPSNEIQTVLDTRPYKNAVDADWSRAYQLGITAVPTFRLNQQVLVGAQPYKVLVNFLESNQVMRRSTES